MRYQVSIRLSGRTLHLYHSGSQLVDGFDEQYQVETAETEALYDLLTSLQFHSLQSPAPDRILDSPEEELSASYGGKTTSVSFGKVKEKPEYILQCRRALFELAGRYSPAMKKALGY